MERLPVPVNADFTPLGGKDWNEAVQKIKRTKEEEKKQSEELAEENLRQLRQTQLPKEKEKLEHKLPSPPKMKMRGPRR